MNAKERAYLKKKREERRQDPYAADYTTGMVLSTIILITIVIAVPVMIILAILF